MTAKKEQAQLQKTTLLKKEPNQQEWFILDAKGKTLGRLASEIAKILRGKHKPTYTPHVDNGDEIIVINADHIRTTGNKSEQKQYTSYSGYPSGLKSRPLKSFMQQRPEYVILHAVKGMLPKNRLGAKMLKRLKVYRGSEHPHAAQQPEVVGK